MSTSEIIAPTVRSSCIVPFNLLHLEYDFDEAQQRSFLSLSPCHYILLLRTISRLPLPP